MILRSSSGYCMPFEEPIKQDVQMSLGYGEQKNPVTGETFFHHGIDFSVNHYLLSADGEEINPLEFLTMLYGNIKALEHNSQMGINELDMNIPSPYDTDRQEIEALMLRFLPSYFEDLQQGAYSLPEHTEQSLRNIFSLGASKHYFYETMPSMANPLGIGNRCMPLATKVQNLLIADFLNYLAMRHQVYLSTMDEVLKKNSKSKP